MTAPADPNPVPLACTLSSDDLRDRTVQWRALFAEHGRDTETVKGHRLLRFAGDEHVAAQLAELVAAERECCAFVEWSLEDDGDGPVVRISGNPEALEAVGLGAG